MVHKVKICINLLVLSMSLIYIPASSFAAYTNLPNMMNNRLASAAAGQIASQTFGLSRTQPVMLASLKSGALVGLLDLIIRRTTSNLLDCPTQSYSEMATTAGSSMARATVSGLLYSFLSHKGYQMNPILYSGIYAVSDTLLTGGFNLLSYGNEDHFPIDTLTSASLWQGIFAMAFSTAGMAVARFFPAHRYAANMIAQISLIYGTAVAYITYIEVRVALAELRSLG